MKKYRTDPAFQAAYHAAQADLLQSVLNQSRQNLTGAFSALADITADANTPPAARVSAARATVELHMKLTEQVDILEQLADLEEWRKEQEQNERY